MEYFWAAIATIGIFGALFVIAWLLLKGNIGLKSTLLWSLGLISATALVVLLRQNWSSITEHLHLPELSASTWWIIAGVVACAVIVGILYKTGVSWLPSFKALMRFLSLVAGLWYVYHVVNAHEKLGSAVFAAYFFSIKNIAIGFSIVGAILISWLWSDGTRNIPVRKILAVIIGCFIVFMLTDFFFPEFFPSLPELWYEGDILSFLKTYGIAILVALLLFLCLFDKPRKGATTVLGFMIAIWIIWKIAEPAQLPSPAVAQLESPKEIAMECVVSSTEMTPIPWPSEKYRWRDIKPDPSGKRPTLLVWEQKSEPKDGDPCQRIGPSSRLSGRGADVPLRVMVDSDAPVTQQITMLYYVDKP